MDRKGFLLALGTYLLWGLLPIYWKFLQHVPALQVVAHRVLWSFLLLLAFLIVSGKIKGLREKLSDLKVLRIYAIAAVLIGVNWLIYVWAVNAGFIVETSLGYFINPLISVMLGMIFFKERLRRLQWVPVILAASGVAYLTISYGRLPWIALSLAFCFGFYGLVKKLAPLNSAHGLTLETGMLLLPAGIYLLVLEFSGLSVFTHAGATSDMFIIGTGLVTTVPLLMFTGAARRIPLTAIGLMQYIAPTIQFMIGIFLYREPFSVQQLFGFGLVWAGLIFFGAESLYHSRQIPPAKAPIQF